MNRAPLPSKKTKKVEEDGNFKVDDPEPNIIDLWEVLKACSTKPPFITLLRYFCCEDYDSCFWRHTLIVLQACGATHVHEVGVLGWVGTRALVILNGCGRGEGVQ